MRTVLLGAVLCSTVFAGEALAFEGGTNLTTRQERAGIFKITPYDGTSGGGTCTATVLSSSVAEDRTWLVTAGHCFSYKDDVYWVNRHFTLPRAKVWYDTDSDTSGTQETGTDPAVSRVFVHPEWRTHAGWMWFGPRDVAMIRVDEAIPIFDENGEQIEEYQRPIFVGPALQVSEPFVNPILNYFSRNAFCGQSDGNLRCDTLSNLWWSPNFRNTFLQLPAGAWASGFYEAGDSGGPLIKYAPGLARQWDGAGNTTRAVLYGAVLGVLQGPTVFCDYIQNGNCNPSDGLATRFEGLGPWLTSIGASSALHQITSWVSFQHRFEVATGVPHDLNAVAESTYSFPAYAGRIVGMGIDKASNKLVTFYDNGFRTTGTRNDLDAFSQAPGPGSDLLPTQVFRGAEGKAHSRIVAMMIYTNGRVYSWYEDGTTYVGSPDDLDLFHGARTFSLPPGKQVTDLVAIASRPAGGVIAYYRDGTKSEGTATDLDAYSALTSIDLGARDPQDILAVDTLANGQTVTLFAHQM